MIFKNVRFNVGQNFQHRCTPRSGGAPTQGGTSKQAAEMSITNIDSKHSKSRHVFKLSGKGMALYVIPLSSCALTCCVIISLIFNYRQITRTECRVANYLPSISAAVGDLTPQRYIFRIGIGLQSAPRLLMAVAYYHHYQAFQVTSRAKLYNILTAANTGLHVLENLCLVGLTYVSSTENFLIHELSFAGFIACSQLYMVLTVVLFKWSRAHLSMDQVDKRSYGWKKVLSVFNIASLFVALYFYWRHNTYCEPGVYTIFALLEYLVVASNIAFHSTFFIDMRGASLQLVTTHPQHTHKHKAS